MSKKFFVYDQNSLIENGSGYSESLTVTGDVVYSDTAENAIRTYFHKSKKSITAVAYDPMGKCVTIANLHYDASCKISDYVLMFHKHHFCIKRD